MMVLGLTGSIGMGKSTAAYQLETLGAHVCNADTVVHALLSEGGAAVAEVAKLFPATLDNGAINRQALGAIVFGDKQKMQALERILHPMVVAEENRFLAQARAKGARVAVLDIPLLYETKAETRCDKVIVVSAPHCVQKCRVMRRPNMTPEKFKQILSAQMPDREKRARADFVVQTGFGKTYSRWQLKRILSALHA